jgi:hypothetical protein
MTLYASEKYKSVNSARLRQIWPPIRITVISRKLVKVLILAVHILHFLLFFMINKLYHNSYVTGGDFTQNTFR